MKTLLSFLLAASFVTTMAQSVPRPEHPRPDLRRDEWLNLNGTWEFGETDDDNDVSWLTKKEFPDKIVVPFCRESKLSGLERKGFVRNVWYRRTFSRPSGWKAPRTIFHIGACDWRTNIYLNGKGLFQQTGGQIPLDFDITDALNGGENTLVVHAFDDTRSGLQALGKQCPALDSYGCLYTRTTGIWQTVWMEGVGSTYIKDIVSNAKADGSLVIDANLYNPTNLVGVVAELYWGDARVDSVVETVKSSGTRLKLKVKKPMLWEPGAPNLYRLKLTVIDNGKFGDVVESYVGFRTITTDGRAILINGKRVFQRLVLDQGFYPDGVWTAPSDQALKHDIEMSMVAGFNGARLHQKVFEPRYLYWADKLGYLVWGEYPNWGLNYKAKEVNTPVHNEWIDILWRDRGHPAIIGWCPFNETPAEAGPLQDEIVAVTRKLDPTRPVIDTSGYVHSVNSPVVLDAHDYDQNPTSFKNRWDSFFGQNALPKRYAGTSSPSVPFMVSEYGGIGWDTTGGWGYGDGPKTLDEFYTRFKGLTDALLDNPDMFGFCYTQITDVEQERNGIYKYDRTPKFDAAKLHAILSRPAAFETKGPSKPVSSKDDWRVIVKSARDGGSLWRTTTEKPAADWIQSGFNDGSWRILTGGFGAKGGFESDTKTPWTTSDIWLRQTFNLTSVTFKSALLAIHYDNASEVYVNGKLVWKSAPAAWNDGYEGMDVSAALKKALKNGQNVVAVHCHQDTGGQFLDLALLVR